MRAGNEAHRFAEGQAALRRGRFHGSELVEHPAEFFPVDLDPPSAHQVQAVGRGEELLDFRLGQRFAVERDAHLEVEQRLLAEARGRLAADGAGDLRTRRAIRSPRRRYADDDPRGLEAWDIGQELNRVGRRPPERVIDLARVDHRLQPTTVGCGALHGEEQREQPRLVRGACVFAEGAAEWQVLRLGLRRQLRRVGRKKRERRISVSTVFGEVEVDAADQVPRRVPAMQKLLDGRLRFSELGSKRLSDFIPERLENRGRQVLGAVHGRRGRGECLELTERGRRDRRLVRIEIGMRADGRDQPRGEVAPVAEVCRKRGPDFSGAELEQSVTRSPSERVLEARRETGRRRLRGVVRAGQQEVAARSQGERRHEDAVPLCGDAPATMKGIRFRF